MPALLHALFTLALLPSAPSEDAPLRTFVDRPSLSRGSAPSMAGQGVNDPGRLRPAPAHKQPGKSRGQAEPRTFVDASALSRGASAPDPTEGLNDPSRPRVAPAHKSRPLSKLDAMERTGENSSLSFQRIFA